MTSISSLDCLAGVRISSVVSSSCARVARGLAVAVIALSAAACRGALDVSDPTLVRDKDIANADGANSRRLDVVRNFSSDVVDAIKDVAVFTDERIVDLPATWSYNEYYLDRRDGQGYEDNNPGNRSDPHLGSLDDIVYRSSIAIPAVRAFSPDSVKGDYLAQLYALRAYAILQMAEDICPGFPINDVKDNVPIFSGAYSTDSAIVYAITQVDTALATAHDSTQIVNLARVVQGRALLDQGRYAAAAAAVASVPTSFAFATVTVSGYNAAFGLVQNIYYWNPTNLYAERLAVGDTEGTNGLPFVSAHDPRVPTVYRLTRYSNTADSLYDQLKYVNLTDSVIVASGLEARLIEAEAALNADDPSWFATLNTLRATMISPAMAAIPVMPTAKSDQVDLLYRERAFWLYLTGRRLGDLRRLIHNYGRSAETVFPSGPYAVRGGNYGTATAIPFVAATEGFYNARVAGGCTSR